MPEEYETVIHRWFDEVWNQKRTDTIEELLSDESVHHGLGGPEGGEVRGVGAFKEFHASFVAAFPNLRVTVEDVVAAGDTIAARYSVTGTHSGEGLGLSAKDQQVDFTGMGICTFKDGKFVEVWNEVDFLKMYAQLGALSLDLK
jgi:steroid delta-isomerase-like uncharacterized protein